MLQKIDIRWDWATDGLYEPNLMKFAHKSNSFTAVNKIESKKNYKVVIMEEEFAKHQPAQTYH